MLRRGLTLLELLLVIGVLLALGAIVMASVMSGLDGWVFSTTVDTIYNQLLLARSQARETRTPVIIRYHRNPPRLAASLLVAGSGTDGGGSPGDGTFVQPTTGDLEPPAVGLIAEGWALFPLPDGFWIARETAEVGDPAVDGAPWAGDRASPPDAAPLEVAVFLPDGSALVGERVVVGDRASHRVWLTVNPWTGLPAFEPLATNDDQTANRDEVGEPDEPTADDFDLPIPRRSPRRQTETAGVKETRDSQTKEASTP